MGSKRGHQEHRSAPTVMRKNSTSPPEHTVARAQAARAEAEARAARVDAIIEAMADPICVLDEHGGMVRLNAAARALFGVDADPGFVALSREAWRQLLDVRDIHGQPIAADQLLPTRVLRGEIVAGERAMDMLVRGRGGHDIIINVTGAPVRDESGTVRGGVLTCREVTASRLMEGRGGRVVASVVATLQALVEEGVPAATTDVAGSEATPPVPRLAPRLAMLARDVLACRRVGIAGLDPDTLAVRPIASAGFFAADKAFWRQIIGGQPLGLFLDAPLIARLAAGEVFALDGSELLRTAAAGARAVLLAPMRLRGRLVGLIAFEAGAWAGDGADERQAQAGVMAQLTVLVIEHDRLLREREEARAKALALRAASARMSEFLAIASHELRTPLTVIKTSVQYSARQARRATEDHPSANADRAASALARAEAQVDRLVRLVEDLVDVARIQSGDLDLSRRPTDLLAVARQAIAIAALAYPARTIEFIGPGAALPSINVDGDRVLRAVGHYLANALKFSPPELPVVVTVRQLNDEAQVTVRDHGPGVPEAEIERIWSLYHRVEGTEVRHGSSFGMGLGLYICRELIELHGGHVGVENAPDGGAIFWLALPL